jgi:hyperosmotically inducible protein
MSHRGDGIDIAEIAHRCDVFSRPFCFHDPERRIAMKTLFRHAVTAVSLSVLLGGPLYGCASTPGHESTGQYIDDASITTKVKAKLLNDSITEGLKVDVNTDRGMVQLSGFADNDNQRERAYQLAQSVAGVKSVRNDLIVR